MQVSESRPPFLPILHLLAVQISERRDRRRVSEHYQLLANAISLMEIRRTEETGTRILAEFEAGAADKWSTEGQRIAAS